MRVAHMASIVPFITAPAKKKMRRQKAKSKADVVVDFNALPPLYVPTGRLSHCLNRKGNGGGMSWCQRSAILYIDSEPPRATVWGDYRFGEFQKSVHVLANAVVIFCTGEKALFYHDKIHLNPTSAVDTHKFTFAGNKNEFEKGSYDAFDDASKRVLLFVRREKAVAFSFYGEVRKLSHNPMDHLHDLNPTWLFEFVDKNMPRSALSYLVDVFD